MDTKKNRSSPKGFPGVVALDIKRRKRVEQQLAESLAKYKSLVESVSDWIWQVNASGQYVYASPQVKKILGYAPEQILGKTPFELMPPEEARRVSRFFESCLKNKMPFAGLENINLRKDGTQVYLETSGSPIIDEHQQVMGYLGIDRDITAKKAAEEVLRDAKQTLEHEVTVRTRWLRKANADLIDEIAANRNLNRELLRSKERYRMLLQASPEPIVVYAPGGMATFVNTAFVKKFGWSDKECIGKRIGVVPKANRKSKMAIRRWLPTSGRPQSFEARLETKSGQVLDCQISSALIQDQNQTPLEHIVILRDVTQLKETESQLRAQSRSLEEANTTLRVLLQRGNREKKAIEERMLDSVKQLILPYLKKIRQEGLDESQKNFIDILEMNVHRIISPFANNLARCCTSLTVKETRVADLVRHGKSTAQIALLLGISTKTVAIHRGNIRKKLGLRNTRENLRTYLLSLED